MPGSVTRGCRRSVLSGLVLSAFGVLLSPPGTAAAVPGGAGAVRVRAASFNIRHGTDPADVLDLERTCEAITALNADVVGLQEVDRYWARSDFVDQPRWLAQRLGMSMAFGANLVLSTERRGQPRREYGTAILSRLPIKKARNVRLPTWPQAEPRGLLRASLIADDVAFGFATTHLSHNNDQERLAQAKATVESLRTAKQPVLLCGDFNDQPASPPVAAITRDYDDAWEVAGTDTGNSYPSHEPGRRIDYIVASGDVETVAATLDTSDPGASDHLPIQGEFMIQRRRGVSASHYLGS